MHYKEPDPLGEGAVWGISRPGVRYGEYPACCQCSQPDSVGGGSDAAVHCHSVLQQVLHRKAERNHFSFMKNLVICNVIRKNSVPVLLTNIIIDVTLLVI